MDKLMLDGHDAATQGGDPADGGAGTRHTDHAHHAGHGPDQEVLYTPEFWDARYGAAEALWSGNPNAQLVAEVGDLAPGTALDVGCGEGGDAIWLAARGWWVTGIDVSTVALNRAAKRAAAAGPDVAERISWQQTDVLVWEPAPLQFDLVSAHFMQLPPVTRETVFGRLAAAVRPGGTLLIVGHHPSDRATSAGRPHMPDLFSTAEQVAAALDPAAWRIMVVASPARQARDPEGRMITIHDAVMRAVRRQ